jgi:dienelactone hydrolase
MGKDDQRLFDYDLSSPVEAISSLVERPIQDDLHDLSYRLPGGLEKGRAWLMVPRQSGPFPFVVALHGGGQDRDAFLAEAGLTAELGMASLLIDLPQARAFPDFSRPDQDQEKFAQTVITVRRGLDYLALRADIDMRRGAIVGFSFGAWIASIVAAVDARPQRAVFIAGVPRMSEFWRTSLHPDVLRVRQGLEPGVMDNYAEASKWIDASECLQRCSNIPLLFQFGAGDELITQEHVRQFTPYVCGTNQLKVYESGSHYQMILNPDARRDRLSWLRNQLAQSK